MKALNNRQLVRRCKHVSAKGNVCHRPAMRSSSHCHIHLNDPALQDDYCKTNLELPAIEGPASIQVAENRVLAALSAGDITRRRAFVYIYALQIARQNVKQLQRGGNRKAEKRADICPPNLA